MSSKFKPGQRNADKFKKKLHKGQRRHGSFKDYGDTEYRFNERDYR